MDAAEALAIIKELGLEKHVERASTPPLTKSPPPTPDSAPFSANVLLTMATAEDSEWRPPPWLSPVWLSTMVVPMIVALPAVFEIAMPPPPASERLPLIVLLMTVTAAGLKMPPPWLCEAVLLATVLPAMNSRPRLAIPPPPVLLTVEQAMEGMRKAAGVRYRPPTASDQDWRPYHDGD